MAHVITFHEKLSLNDICIRHNLELNIILDERIDISVTQMLVAVVRYFDTDKGLVIALLDTVVAENGVPTIIRIMLMISY